MNPVSAKFISKEWLKKVENLLRNFRRMVSFPICSIWDIAMEDGDSGVPSLGDFVGKRTVDVFAITTPFRRPR